MVDSAEQMTTSLHHGGGRTGMWRYTADPGPAIHPSNH